MKHLLILCCALSLCSIKAQIPKGTQFISGQIGLSTTSDHSKNTSQDSYKFSPTYGYYFAPNWAVVLSAGYKTDIDHSQTIDKSQQLLNVKNRSSSFVVTPSLRKFWVLDPKFSVFCQLDFPLEFGTIKQTNSLDSDGREVATTKNNYSSLGVSLKPGIDYFLNPRWKIAATIGEIGYYNLHYAHKDADKRRFNSEVNLSSVQFAVKYIIPAKHRNE